jgi:signal peptidase I
MGRILVRTGLALALSIVLAGCSLLPFGGRTYEVPGESMEPTIMAGDTVRSVPLPDPLTRGTLVVHRRPGVEGVFARRVVGLPGEQITIEDGKVVVDGQPLAEPYLAPGTVTEGGEPVTLGSDEVYLLGDNRANANDSRISGPVKLADIVSAVEAP